MKLLNKKNLVVNQLVMFMLISWISSAAIAYSDYPASFVVESGQNAYSNAPPVLNIQVQSSCGTFQAPQSGYNFVINNTSTNHAMVGCQVSVADDTTVAQGCWVIQPCDQLQINLTSNSVFMDVWQFPQYLVDGKQLAANCPWGGHLNLSNGGVYNVGLDGHGCLYSPQVPYSGWTTW